MSAMSAASRRRRPATGLQHARPGHRAEQLTQFISALNDALTRRIVELNLERHDFAGRRLVLAGFRLEGRDEQTFSTDQDNGIVFALRRFPRSG